MIISAWARKRFGSTADRLTRAVPAAMVGAHADSVAAQVSSGTSKHDPYGHTLKRRQFECLIEHAADIPGISVLRPAGLHSPLVQIDETRCLLYPWRYARDLHARRTDARIVMSDIRRALLAPADPLEGQFTIDDAAVPDAQWAEYLRQHEEQEDVQAQLRAIAPVVIVGFASNPALMTGLGWGEAEFGEDGRVAWLEWEPLAQFPAQSMHRTTSQTRPTPSTVLASSTAATGAPDSARFDAEPLADLPMGPRAPLGGPAQQEEQAPDSHSGTEDEQS